MPSPDEIRERELRAAHNQAMFRAVNEQIHDLEDRLGIDGTFAIACECDTVSCYARIELSPAAYEAARQSPHTFVVLRDHVDPSVERVVASHDGYLVVEMTGRAARKITEETATTIEQGRHDDAT